MNEEITIYVPVYNGEKTIKKCLDSIFDQTIKPTKILIINDNSDDGTLDILKSYKENIEIINNNPNKGVSFSRNIAVNHLNTKYIASIDADVVLSKDWLEKVFNSLKENNATLVGGRLYEKFVENPDLPVDLHIVGKGQPSAAVKTAAENAMKARISDSEIRVIDGTKYDYWDEK